MYVNVHIDGGQRVDFRTATDRAAPCVTHQELADALKVSVTSIRAARLAPDGEHHRSPPPGWRTALAKLLRKRSRDHAALADQLEREAEEAEPPRKGA